MDSALSLSFIFILEPPESILDFSWFLDKLVSKLKDNDKAFKGLSPVTSYQEKGVYKYTYGTTTDYNQILRTKKKVNEKFKDAFIVAFINGERVNTQQAIALYKENNQ